MPKLKIKAVNKKGEVFVSAHIELLINYLKNTYRKDNWGDRYLLKKLIGKIKDKNASITYKSWNFTKIDDTYIPQSGDKILTKQVTVSVTEVD